MLKIIESVEELERDAKRGIAVVAIAGVVAFLATIVYLAVR